MKKYQIVFTREQKLAIIQRGRKAEPPVSDPQLATILGLTRERVGQLGGRRGHTDRSAVAEKWHTQAVELFMQRKYTASEIADILGREKSATQSVIIRSIGAVLYDEIKESVWHDRILIRLVEFFRRHKPIMSTTLFAKNRALYAATTGKWKEWRTEIEKELAK